MIIPGEVLIAQKPDSNYKLVFEWQVAVGFYIIYCLLVFILV